MASLFPSALAEPLLLPHSGCTGIWDVLPLQLWWPQTHDGQHGEARSLVVVAQQPLGPSKEEKFLFQAALSGTRQGRHEGTASAGAHTRPWSPTASVTPPLATSE